MSIYLGVNIDHVATLRQARGTRYPDPIQAAIEPNKPVLTVLRCIYAKIAGIFRIAMSECWPIFCKPK